MAGRGRGRGAWKPKTVGAQFAQQASEDLGMKLGSAMKVCFLSAGLRGSSRRVCGVVQYCLDCSVMSHLLCTPLTSCQDSHTMNTMHTLLMLTVMSRSKSKARFIICPTKTTALVTVRRPVHSRMLCRRYRPSSLAPHWSPRSLLPRQRIALRNAQGPSAFRQLPRRREAPHRPPRVEHASAALTTRWMHCSRRNTRPEHATCQTLTTQTSR